jgi:hypothetical protein
MATVEEMTAGARVMLRDYPTYFEIDEGPLNVLTIRLPHPLVSGNTLQVYVTTPNVDPVDTALTDKWTLDDRNGLLKLTEETALGKQVLVAGYHYSWFSDSDLSFHVGQVFNEIIYNSDLSLDNLQPVVMQVVMMGGVVHALWSLAMELSLDIDVSTPEGMFIPARQRFNQVLQTMQYWENQYQQNAAMLNIGLNAIEIFRLRRIAWMTGRYVPVYREREFDDPRPPERLYPPIPYGGPRNRAGEVEDVIEQWTMASLAAHPPEELGP